MLLRTRFLHKKSVSLLKFTSTMYTSSGVKFSNLNFSEPKPWWSAILRIPLPSTAYKIAVYPPDDSTLTWMLPFDKFLETFSREDSSALLWHWADASLPNATSVAAKIPMDKNLQV